MIKAIQWLHVHESIEVSIIA